MDTVSFARAVRRLATAARARGLVVPSFRSPPRTGNRSLRRRQGAPPVVSVRLSGRPDDEVLADMVDGVLLANHRPVDPELRRQLVEDLAAQDDGK